MEPSPWLLWFQTEAGAKQGRQGRSRQKKADISGLYEKKPYPIESHAATHNGLYNASTEADFRRYTARQT